MAQPPSYRPRILFLDAYDSFANNITTLLATLLNADVHVLPIDGHGDESDTSNALSAFSAELACYDAVVCGPGPGSPDCAADIGLMRRVWELTSVPALGICLGFQSLVAAHGGRIRRLRSGGLHGMVRSVDIAGNADGKNIFEDMASFRATLYHSLGADIGQDSIADEAWPAARWQATATCPDLIPLAWVEETISNKGDSARPVERLLMGVRHRTLPFWGVQYHPESVCTDTASHAVLTNWFRAAARWNTEHGRVRAEPRAKGGLLARRATRPSLLSLSPSVLTGATGHRENGTNGHAGDPQPLLVHARTIPLPSHVQVPDLAEALQAAGGDPENIILDSATAAVGATNPHDASADSESEAVRGRYSIVALDVSSALRIEYCTGNRFATIRKPSSTTETVPLGEQSIWQLLAEFHESKRLEHGGCTNYPSSSSPFFGGFMGYVSYEQGLDDIGVSVPASGVDAADGGRGHSRPDICWAWVTRSLVVDHYTGVVHVQSLAAHDACWVDDAVARLQSAWQAKVATEAVYAPPAVASIQLPDTAVYEDLVRRCQEHIAAGESYELCLTGETRITTAPSPTTSSWHLYRTLREKNPAPFASYVRLGAATLVSSSPERFLCFGRSPSRAPAPGQLTCSMRPMKGTVRRSAAVATLAQAAALLHVPKEEAENLMIVDLVRHDLHSVCGPGHVTVPRLLQVEPYGHVFQMVSVVEGRLGPGTDSGPGPPHTGLDVLSVSLPPGSMTGAPKKRSCMLLRGLEACPSRSERSLYSGVVGYVCVTGRGDWSVTIRSLFRWDDESTAEACDAAGLGPRTDVWHIGAGGAVTILSTPEGEREEMFTKLAGPLGVFGL